MAAQIAVQPVRLPMRATAAPTSSTITVANEGAELLTMRAYSGDFDQDVDGRHTFLPAGEHARSCAGRVRVVPEDFTVEPGGRQEVRVTMAPGESTCWGLVFVETRPQGSGIQVSQRIGVKVYGMASERRLEGELLSVALEPAPEDGGMLLHLEFRNAGEDPIRAEGELEVRSLTGDILGVAAIPPFSVLPGHVRRATVDLEMDLAPGEYLAIPILDFGADYLAGGQAVFRVPEP